ncbi:SAM-dependent methyltransferase [Rhizorhabdus histidinilytica]
MDIIAAATAAVERLPLPDAVTLAGVEFLVGRTGRKLARQPDIEAAFARAMDGFPIAIHTDDANAQHYEVPAAFFDLCLGPRRKYSCCHYDGPRTTIAEAEEAALAQTVEHADLKDGQEILELGCGWGSLSLYMAARYPNARITAVSNSHSQREHIEKLARAQGSTNLTVVTCDMNDFHAEGRFDRVVSVEMFEHMSNWRALLTRVKGWLKPDGLLFIHIFTHDRASYRFDHGDKADWIAQHFFTGGIMPSHGLIRHFPTCSRSSRNGAGTASIMPAPRSTGSPASTPTSRRSRKSSVRPMARTRSCGSGAGGCSSWRPPDYLATRTASPGQ